MGIISALMSLLAVVVMAIGIVMAFRYASRTEDPFEKNVSKTIGIGLSVAIALALVFVTNAFFMKIDTPLSPHEHQAPAQSRPPPDAIAPKIEATRPDPFTDAHRRHRAVMDAVEDDMKSTPETAR